MLLENKAALVTGGSSGIGRASALALAREGAQVLIGDVNGEGGAETVALIEAMGGTASYITGDVRNEDEVKTMIDAVIARYGQLDIALNVAGISGELAPFHMQTETHYTAIMDTNVKGVWLCMKYELAAMRKHDDGGAIVNLASAAGLVGLANGALYAASKHAVIGLTKSAALEVAHHKIRVNAVCPSYLNTPMISAKIDDHQDENGIHQDNPMRRLGSNEEIAEALVWLVSDRASFVNGVALAADGGLTAM